MEDTIDLQVDTRELEAALLRLSKRMAGDVMREALQADAAMCCLRPHCCSYSRANGRTSLQSKLLLPPGILKADMHTEIQISRKYENARIKIGPSKDIGGSGCVPPGKTDGRSRLTGSAGTRIRDISGKHFIAAAFDESAGGAVDVFLNALKAEALSNVPGSGVGLKCVSQLIRNSVK